MNTFYGVKYTDYYNEDVVVENNAIVCSEVIVYDVIYRTYEQALNKAAGYAERGKRRLCEYNDGYMVKPSSSGYELIDGIGNVEQAWTVVEFTLNE